MRKLLALLIICMMLFFLIEQFYSLNVNAEESVKKDIGISQGSYDTQVAVNYADTWWNSHKPNYNYYPEEDCANFVSQCLIAGGLNLEVYPNTDSRGCIINCGSLNDYLVNYLNAQHKKGYRSDPHYDEPLWFSPGDVAIFGDSNDSWQHAVFAVTGDIINYTTCDAHSNNQHHKPIQFFFDNSNWEFVTYYHITNANLNIPYNKSYNREAAVSFAASYYNKVCPDGFFNATSNCDSSDNTHFVSYALMQGGIPMPSNSTCSKSYYGYLSPQDLSVYLYYNGYVDTDIKRIYVYDSNGNVIDPNWENKIVDFLSSHTGNQYKGDIIFFVYTKTPTWNGHTALYLGNYKSDKSVGGIAQHSYGHSFTIPATSNCYSCTTGYGSYDDSDYGPIRFIHYMANNKHIYIYKFVYYHINIRKPDFALSASSSPQTVTQGSSTTYTVNLTAQNGFNSSTSLSASGLPSGATYSFNPLSVTPTASGATSTLAINISSSTPAGTYTITITASGGGKIHTTNVTLTIQLLASFHTFSIPNTQSAPGSTITIPINVNDADGIAGGNFTVTFDSSILAVKNISTTSFTKSFLLVKNLNNPGQVIISMASATGIQDSSHLGGALASITFTVSSSATAGTTSNLSFTSASIYDESINTIPSTTQNGVFTVTVGGLLLGDVDGDNSITAADATLVLKYSAGLITLTPSQQALADVNQDGLINVADAIMILRKATGSIP